MANGRAAAVMAAAARENPAVGRYALLLADGFAVDPDLTDPTSVLAAAFADLAAPLIVGGVRRYYLLHTVLPRLSEALSNLGFGRRSAYGIQPAAARAAGTRSSTPRSPGPMTMAIDGSRSISTPLTRCRGHSGCTPASARPDTASSASSTAGRRSSPDPPAATED